MKISLNDSSLAKFRWKNKTYSGYSELSDLLKEKKTFSIDKEASSFYLRMGFLPPPYSGISDVERISFLSPERKFNIQEVSKIFPYYQQQEGINYDRNQFEDTFNKLIFKSIHKKSSYLLMLSGGKDSTAILLALANLGFKNIICATYVSGVKEDESTDAKRVCDALGYEHYVVKRDPSLELELLVDCLKSSISPIGDPALPSYLKIIYDISKNHSFDAVIDGMGNDIYMGHIASKKETNLQYFSIPSAGLDSAWGLTDMLFMNKYISYLTQSVLMYKTERFFSGSRLSISNIKKMNIKTTIMNKYIKNMEASIEDSKFFNSRALIRGGIYDDLSGCEKARVATNYFEKKVVFPFLDQDFAEYYLSLEEKWKFDKSRRVNKIALRDYIDNNFKKRGILKNVYLTSKGSFRFDVEFFVQTNIKMIISFSKQADEITNGAFNINLMTTKISKHIGDYTAALQLYLIFTWCIWLKGINAKGIDIV